MNAPTIIHIQKFSIHDGDGIRTTVFLKGCPLSCAWCHNPESQNYQPELMFDAERCTGCGSCIAVCPHQAIALTDSGLAETDREKCTACGLCVLSCIYNARSVVGMRVPVGELVRRLLRDRMFYEVSGGGVTLSGGEVMAQDMAYMEELVRALHHEEVSVNIDTCGDAPYENFQKLLPYIDTFLYDLKAATPQIHRQYTGRDNARIIENLKRLSADGAKINLRIPVIPGVNSSEEEMQKMIQLIHDHGIRLVQVNLLPYHKVGMDKNLRLGRTECQEFQPPDNGLMQHRKQMWLNAGFHPAMIGG